MKVAREIAELTEIDEQPPSSVFQKFEILGRFDGRGVNLNPVDGTSVHKTKTSVGVQCQYIS